MDQNLGRNFLEVEEQRLMEIFSNINLNDTFEYGIASVKHD